jgi:hypothetical protein
VRGAQRDMFRRSFLLRRARSAWLLVGCLMLSVLVTSALVSALLSFYSAALPATVRKELAKPGDMSVAISDQVSGSAASVTKLVSTRMGTAFGQVPHRQYQAVWSNELALPGQHSSGTGSSGNVAAVEAASMPGIGSYAALSSGSWPAAPRAGQPIPAALPASAAAALKVGVGAVLKLHYVGGRNAVRLEVTGLFRPRDPRALYWQVNQIGSAGVSVSGGFATYGPAVVSPAAFGTGALAANAVTYVELPSVGQISPADLGSLATRMDSAVAALEKNNSSVTTLMPQALTSVAEGLAAARSLLIISGLQLLLLSAAALALAGRLLASHREQETALLAARGAARWQLIRPSLAEGALICALAAAAGAVAGVRLAALLLSSLPGHPDAALALGRQAWYGAGFVLIMCLSIVLWPAIRPPGMAAVRVRRGRQAAIASVAAAGADVALIALAVVSTYELLRRSAAVGATAIDPVIVAAPALALAGLALVPLRLLPFVAKGLEKLTARGKRLGTAMANWEISRRPVRQSGPALLVILAVGTSTLALAQYQSWQQSVHDQAAFAAGAQVRVGLVNPEPLSGVTGITRLRGVKAAMPVSQQALGANAQLLVIGGPQAAGTITMRPDLSAQMPLKQLWSYLDQPQVPPEGLEVPGRPERIAISASVAGGLAGQLGPVSGTVIVQDAYGLTYSFPTGTIPADGRSHQLVIQLGSSRGIAYPLRLLSVALTYNIPFATTSARAKAADASAVMRFNSVAASPRPTGPFGAPFAGGRELAGWETQTSAPGLDAISNHTGGLADGAVRPAVVSWAAAGQAAELKFSPGHGPKLSSRALAGYGFTSLPGQVQITIPPPEVGVPVIATTGFVRANGGTGAVAISIGSANVTGTVVGTVSQFPTVPGGQAVVADQTILQDALISAGGAPLPASSWWLSTVGGRPPGGLPSGSSVVAAAAVGAALQHDPVSAAPIKAVLAVALAAALLAVFGFCVSVAASARGRRSQRALLAALGVPAADQARLFCLEELMISGPAALVGLGLGVGLAHLLIPAVTLTATAGIPVPAVLVRIPVLWVALIAVAMPVIPVLAAVVATLRQLDPAAELRVAEAAG